MRRWTLEKRVQERLYEHGSYHDTLYGGIFFFGQKKLYESIYLLNVHLYCHHPFRKHNLMRKSHFEASAEVTCKNESHTDTVNIPVILFSQNSFFFLFGTSCCSSPKSLLTWICSFQNGSVETLSISCSCMMCCNDF